MTIKKYFNKKCPLELSFLNNLPKNLVSITKLLVCIDLIYRDPKLPQVFLWWWSSFSGKAKRQTKFPPNLSSSSCQFFYFLFPRFCDNSIVSGRHLSHIGAKFFFEIIFFWFIFTMYFIYCYSLLAFINLSWNRNFKEL